MTDHGKGWVIFLAALAVSLGFLGNEVGKMQDAGELLSMKFIGEVLQHIGTVITAFVGGKMIPPNGNGDRR